MTPAASDQIEQDAEGQVRPFADVLIALNRGRTHLEVSRQLQELVAAVTATGKKGSIAITIAIAPTKSEGVLEVTDTVTVKAPKPNRAASIFYADDDGNLVRDNPHQPSLWGSTDVGADPSDRPARKAQ